MNHSGTIYQATNFLYTGLLKLELINIVVKINTVVIMITNQVSLERLELLNIDMYTLRVINHIKNFIVNI